MTITETEHDWFVRQIPSALANGLSESERQRFDAHAASCAECGRAMYDAQEMENQLAAAIGDLRPEAGLEDRIVAELPRRLVIIGFRYRRVAAAVAGIVVVGAAGYFAADWLRSEVGLRESITGPAAGFAYRQQEAAQTSPPSADAQNDRSVLQQQPDVDQLAQKPLGYPVFANRAQSSLAPGGGFGGGGGGFAADDRERRLAVAGGIVTGQAEGGGEIEHAPAADGVTQAPTAASAAPVPVTAPAPAEPPAEEAKSLQDVPADRKIIRTGEMNFEVDNFDAAYKRLYDIVHEFHGFIGSTDSERLPNGKVHGDITVRVPPENLDTLVLALRALGDLQSQQVNSQDITREYTDLESELRAGKAMEDRLIDLIRTGKGQIKELLAAENELGDWRAKDEKIQGEINYDNNQIALSTLTVTLTEKDLGQAAVASETRTVSAGLEVEDVRRVHDDMLQAVDAAKGHVIHAELSELEAGEFTANIVAAIPPDAAGGVIDHLQQLGHVTRMESHTEETINGQSAPPGMKVERADTVLNLSIFNVAAYTARVTDNVSVGCADVESAYRALLDFVNKSDGGRVVSSSLTRPTPDSSAGSVVFELRETSADAALAYLRELGAVLQLNVTQNPDSSNVTSSKRAFTVTLAPINEIAARETDELTLLPRSGDLKAAFNNLLEFAAKPENGARVIDKDLEQDNGTYTAASISMEVSRATLGAANSAIAAAGKIIAQKASRQPDSANSVDSKVLFNFSFVNVDAMEPQETLTRTLAANDVAQAYHVILDAANGLSANVHTAQLDDSDSQHVSGDLEFLIPADKQAIVQDAIDKASVTLGGSVQRVPAGEVATDLKVRFRLHLVEADQLPPRRTYQMEVQAAQPISASAEVANAAVNAGGKIVEQSSNVHSNGSAEAHLVVELPLSAAAALDDAACGKGTVHTNQSNEDTSAPGGAAARGRLEMQFVSETPVLADDNGILATIKSGLVTSVRGLVWSLQWVVIGLCLVGPWTAIGWVGWKIWKRRKV